MAGIISNVDSDVQKLRKLKNEIENVKKALMGINIKVDIDIAKGLQSQLTSLLGQYDVLVDKIAAAEGKIMLSVSRINKATEKIVKAQEVVSKPTADPAQNGDAARQTNTAETESVRAQAKAYDDLKTEINGILGTREENIKRMVEEMNAIRLINAEIKKITKSQGEYSSLSSAQRKRLEQLNNSLLTHKEALAEVRQTLNNNVKLDNVAATSMKGLSQSLSRMRIAYRELTEEERNSPFGKELLASINQADAKIKELDATIGNHQRNVGNYGKQWNGLSMSIQQVGRELPSLAYGPKVFFSAISNNLPILADEIKRARIEYDLLKKSGQSATPVWKQVASSLFSWQTALTVGITLLTLYGDKVVDWVAGLFNAKNVMKSLVDIQQQLNDVQLKGVQNAQSEITKLELLYKATQNASKPIRERKKAVDELQKSYPDFFKNLSEEEILTGKAADAYARLTSSIIASARARAAQDKMTENAKKILENEAKITEEYAKRENAQLKLDKQIELRNKIDREANPDMYAGQQMMVGAALGKVEEIDEGIAKLRREIYELNKSQNELAQNIDVNDLIFNPNEDSSKIGEEERKRRQEEADKQLKQQEQLFEELLQLRFKNQQDEINLMKEGSERKRKQIELDYQMEYSEILKLEKEWSAKSGGTLTQEQSIEVSRRYTNAENKYNKGIAELEGGSFADELRKSMNEYLAVYGDYINKRNAIIALGEEKKMGKNEWEQRSIDKDTNHQLSELDEQANKTTSAIVQLFGDMKDKTLKDLQEINERGKEALDFLKSGQWDASKGVELGITETNFKEWSQDPEKIEAITNAIKENEQAVDDLRPAYDKAADGIKKFFAAGSDPKKLTQALQDIQDGLNGIMQVGSFLSDTLSSLGDAFGSGALSGMAEGINVAMDSVNSAMQGAQAGAMFGPIGASAGAAIGLVSSLASSIAKIHDKKNEKQIQRLQEQIDALDRSYDQLGRSIEKAYSTDASKLIEQQNTLLEQQKILIQKQIAEEKDKKKTDWDRIKVWENQIEDINDLIEDNKEKAVDAIFGEDLKSAIDNFAKDYADAWSQGKDKAISAKDTVKKMMQQMVTESIKAAIQSSKSMEQIRQKLQEFYVDNVLSGWEQDYIYNMAEQLQQELDRQFGWADDLFKNEETKEQQSASGRGFGTEMTHEDAGELSGRFTALQIAGEEIKNQNAIQVQSLNLLTMKADDIFRINTEVRNIADDTRDLIAQSYLELVQISENTGNSAKYLKDIKNDIAEVKRNTSKL